MTTTAYSTTLVVSQAAEKVYHAINQVSDWWSTSFEGSTANINDEFTVRFGEVYITSKVLELVPSRRIEWLVTDCNKPWLKNKKEWNGTKMIWEISIMDGKTQLMFIHEGLVPEIECYGACSNAWADYLQNSLLKLINTGTGKPTITKTAPIPDFTTTIIVDQEPETVFSAINHVRGWWSEAIEGSTDKQHEEFIYQYKDIHQCRMQITEFVPGKKVVWQVMDNYFKFTKDKSEWKGTTIVFEIFKKDGQTQLRFTHQGLVPQYECFEICSNAWTDYVQNSLRLLITTGKGNPNEK